MAERDQWVIHLRPYQLEAADATELAWESARSVLVDMATGTGKTVLFIEMARRARASGHRCLIVVDSTELVEQTRLKIKDILHIDADIEQADLSVSTNPIFASDVAIATIQSLRSGPEGAKRYQRFEPGHFTRLFIDECFVSGTLVDGKPIESLSCGDMVWCRLPDSTIEKRPIVRVFRKRPKTLTTINTESGMSVTCTSNHPFWTQKGWVDAGNLTPNDTIKRIDTDEKPDMRRVRKTVRLETFKKNMLTRVFGSTKKDAEKGLHATSEGVQMLWRGVLSQIQENMLRKMCLETKREGHCCVQHHRNGKRSKEGEKQSNGERGCSESCLSNNEIERSQAENTRWKRAWADAMGENDVRSPLVANQCGCGDKTPKSISTLLQNRCGQSGKEDRNRDRWWIAQLVEGSSSGRKKTTLLRGERVDSITVHQPDGEGRFGDVCPDGYVYNIEVEEGHTYFANQLLVHNCHLSITPTTIEVVNHFMQAPNCRMAGYTATPSRADGKALGQLYEVCPVRYHILDAIKDGYLVPVRGRIVRVQNVSVSSIKHPDGQDFTTDQVSEVMSAQGAIIEQAAGLLDICDGPTMVFCPDVRHAEILSARLNQSVQGCAEVVSGRTPKKERDEIIKRFRDGDFRFICNCMVLTKGFDCDIVRYIAMCRFTKSWSLFVQCTGRSTRPLDGILNGIDSADERKKAIKESEKPHATILSFVGREGPMNLVGPADALAGDESPPEVSLRAHEMMEEQPDIDVVDALEQAAEEINAETKRRAEQAVVNFDGGDITQEETDLFDKASFKIAISKDVDIAPRHRLAYLNMYGFSKKEIASWSGTKVAEVISFTRERHAKNLCTKAQARQIARHYPEWEHPEMDREYRMNMTKGEAGRLLGQAVSGRTA